MFPRNWKWTVLGMFLERKKRIKLRKILMEKLKKSVENFTKNLRKKRKKNAGNC